MQEGVVVSIHLAPAAGEPTFAVREVMAVAGAGLEGDRNFQPLGAGPPPEREITLIEQEALEAAARDHGIELAPGEHRRNVVTRGVRLNHLLGKEFLVGPVRARGVELSEPCRYLQELTGRPGLIKALVHRGGLGVQILDGGPIRVGDPITAQADSAQADTVRADTVRADTVRADTVRADTPAAAPRSGA